MQETDNEIIGKFSSHLFWDTDREKLDMIQHRAFIIKRVLEYGLYEDWKLLRTRLSIQEIARVTQGFRELDPKTLAFVSTISQTPKETFRCYITKQLNPPHWNF